MSLSGLHSLMFNVKCGVSIGSLMNLQSLDWKKLIHESWVASVFFLYVSCLNL